MSLNTKRFSPPFLLYLVVLLGLVYMFRAELFVTGIRLYVAVVHNPKAEQLLGDYYQNNALLSGDLAKSFYASSMKKYKEELPATSGEQQAFLKLRIGQLYLCGKGVEPNATEAKHWFEEALALANGPVKAPEVLISEIKQGLSFANEGNPEKIGIGSSKMIQPCHLQSEGDFFKTLKP